MRKIYRPVFTYTALTPAVFAPLSGLAINPVTAIDAVNGNRVTYGNGRNYLYVKNAHATAACTIKPKVAASVPEGSTTLTITNSAITIPALTTKLIGGFSAVNFKNSEGYIEYDWALNSSGSGQVAADVTVQVVTFP